MRVRLPMPADIEMLKTGASIENCALSLLAAADAIDEFKRNQFGATIIPAKDRDRVTRLLRGLATILDENSVAVDARQKIITEG